MIGFGQEDEIKKITLGPEIWWHQCCLPIKRITERNSHTQLMFTFSDLGWQRVLSVSEPLVVLEMIEYIFLFS